MDSKLTLRAISKRFLVLFHSYSFHSFVCSEIQEHCKIFTSTAKPQHYIYKYCGLSHRSMIWLQRIKSFLALNATESFPSLVNHPSLYYC